MYQMIEEEGPQKLSPPLPFSLFSEPKEKTPDNKIEAMINVGVYIATFHDL